MRDFPGWCTDGVDKWRVCSLMELSNPAPQKASTDEYRQALLRARILCCLASSLSISVASSVAERAHHLMVELAPNASSSPPAASLPMASFVSESLSAHSDSERVGEVMLPSAPLCDEKVSEGSKPSRKWLDSNESDQRILVRIDNPPEEMERYQGRIAELSITEDADQGSGKCKVCLLSESALVVPWSSFTAVSDANVIAAYTHAARVFEKWVVALDEHMREVYGESTNGVENTVSGEDLLHQFGIFDEEICQMAQRMHKSRQEAFARFEQMMPQEERLEYAIRRYCDAKSVEDALGSSDAGEVKCDDFEVDLAALVLKDEEDGARRREQVARRHNAMKSTSARMSSDC